jgi:hypothetical protein
MRAPALLALLVSALAHASEPSLAAFASLPADPPPPELVRGLHYWVSNEDRLDLFHAEVKEKGGVYVGVGTDQNYLLAGWARSELLVLLDFDQAVVDLHRVYGVLFREAETPEAFLRLWRQESRPEVRRLLKESRLRPSERAAALRAHATARWSVERRLLRVIEQMKQASLPCFLVDAAEYGHVRRLFLEDKVFLVRGDLTARRSLPALGQAVRQAGLTVKVLYLSNAEQYFPYGAQYRHNIRALPMEADTVVVRTSGQRGVPRVRGTYYHYNTQAGPGFAAWLGDAKTRNVLAMLKHAPPAEVRGLSRLEQGPAEARLATLQRVKEARALKWKKKPVKRRRREATL